MHIKKTFPFSGKPLRFQMEKPVDENVDVLDDHPPI
jgi:hypothetical protein